MVYLHGVIPCAVCVKWIEDGRFFLFIPVHSRRFISSTNANVTSPLGNERKTHFFVLGKIHAVAVRLRLTASSVSQARKINSAWNMHSTRLCVRVCVNRSSDASQIHNNNNANVSVHGSGCALHERLGTYC